MELLFGAHIPLKTLATLCRQFGIMLDSGIPIRKALKVAAKKIGHPPTRAVLEQVCERIDEGSDVTSALRETRSGFFPDLFLDMVGVSEESGAMPEVLRHLADHYDNSIRLRKEFLQSITWPAFQLIAAIVVIAILILVLGMVGTTPGGPDMSFLVFGLSGPSGALIWLGLSFGSIAGIIAVYRILPKFFAGRRVLDGLLLKLPVLGNCLRCFAIARFSWAFYLTQQTGMPIKPSLDSSLRATGNGAFMDAYPDILTRILEGGTLTDSFAASGLFPEDFIEMVSVAEESGTVPEALHRLSPQFEDAARRSLKAVTSAGSVLVWLIVAGFIIFFVFRFALWYVDQINNALAF